MVKDVLPTELLCDWFKYYNGKKYTSIVHYQDAILRNSNYTYYESTDFITTFFEELKALRYQGKRYSNRKENIYIEIY